ncbi:transposable element Tcb2 transposase [Trichonephila clavipes]|nr:transposable element Tcb2 transposase [Trichonephila clavipes]
MISEHNDRHSTVVNDRTVLSKQLTALISTFTGLLMLALPIRQRLLHRGLCANVPLYRIYVMTHYRQLRLQRAHEHNAWHAYWHQVVFSDESWFNLGTMMAAFALDAMLVNTVFQSALSNDIVD